MGQGLTGPKETGVPSEQVPVIPGHPVLVALSGIFYHRLIYRSGCSLSPVLVGCPLGLRSVRVPDDTLIGPRIGEFGDES
jgi:hypothetical protein